LAPDEAEDEGVTEIAFIILIGKERAVVEANIRKRAKEGLYSGTSEAES